MALLLLMGAAIVYVLYNRHFSPNNPAYVTTEPEHEADYKSSRQVYRETQSQPPATEPELYKEPKWSLPQARGPRIG